MFNQISGQGKPGVFDTLTRLDELLEANTNAIRDLQKFLDQRLASVAPSGNGDDTNRRQQLLAGTDRPYEKKLFSLTTARTNEEVLLEGDFIVAWTSGSYKGLGVRLNNTQNDIIYFDRQNPITTKFYKLYLTTNIQVGETLEILIGREASAEAQTTETIVTTAQKFYTVSTDKDSYFTTGLAQYAKEDESITGLLSNKVRITNIVIQADQNLHFWLVFWSTDGYDNTDLDLDTFLGAVELDLSVWGLRPGGANQYYMSLEDVNLDYQDVDGTNELHISLYNADTTSKIAGATGEVKVDFKYEMRT